MNSVGIKPLTVNQCWQGRRVKTAKHRQYREDLAALLPKGVFVPDGKLEVAYTFKVSSKLSDYDNLIKAFQDALCENYGFDDRQIYKAVINKVDVKKGEECVAFDIRPLYVECETCWTNNKTSECSGEHAADAGYS